LLQHRQSVRPSTDGRFGVKKENMIRIPETDKDKKNNHDLKNHSLGQ